MKDKFLKKIKNKFIHSQEEVDHNKKIRGLQNKYCKISKQPSNWSRIWLIFIFFIIALIVAYFLEIDFIENPKESSLSIIKLQTLIITAPIAFIIWIFRDKNKLLELENNRKDTNLKKFQQLQRWATGNIDGDSGDNKISLQISALHSLVPYLKGEHGNSFKRGAYEIFRSELATQHKKILDNINKEEINIQNAIEKCPLTKQLNIIASEEWFALLINHDFPTSNVSLVGVDLSNNYLRHKKFNKFLNLSGANLNGADLIDAKLSGADLTDTNLTRADLNGADLTDANLTRADLRGADLRGADLNGAHLKDVNLTGANLGGADLSGAKLGGVKLGGADLTDAKLGGADLTYSYLTSADLRGANLTRTDLSDADLIGTKLEGVYSHNELKPMFLFEERIKNRIGKKTDLSGVKGVENCNLKDAETGTFTQEMADEIISKYNNRR